MDNGETGEDVRISGTGQISGGNYGKISISGSGTVAGDVVAKEVIVAGSASFLGKVQVQSITITGSCDISGGLEADAVNSRGSLDVDKNINSHKLKSYGSLKVKGDITAEEIYFAGSSEVNGSLKADSFTSRGSFAVDGLITADDVEIWLASENSAGEVGGGRIEITKRSAISGFDSEKISKGVKSLERSLDRLGEKLGFSVDLDEDEVSTGITKFGEKINHYITEMTKGKFESRVIEGDELILDGIKAETVRGSRVTVGEDCEIDRIEYSDKIEVTEGAKIGEQVRL